MSERGLGCEDKALVTGISTPVKVGPENPLAPFHHMRTPQDGTVYEPGAGLIRR